MKGWFDVTFAKGKAIGIDDLHKNQRCRFYIFIKFMHLYVCRYVFFSYVDCEWNMTFHQVTCL